MKRPKERLQKVVVVGATPAGIAATNKLGELGIRVALVDSASDLDKKLSDDQWKLNSGMPFNYAHRPGMLRILRNSGIRCILPARVNAIKHSQQGFSVSLVREQTFVDPERCILCGKCHEVCPVSDADGNKALKYTGRFSLPGRPVIDKRRSPLCTENCPLGVNAQGYVALAKAGKYAEALNLVREKNILPGVCGRICTHPCEDSCRRSELDEAVSIRAIKRFVADYGVEHPETMGPPEPKAKRSEKFAVVGSGPAGLAAAAELARRGCGVVVYDSEKKAGGLLRYGIGKHRLPEEVLDADLSYIEKMGVEFSLGRPVDLSADLEILKEGYDGVIVAAGAWRDKKLGVDGENLDGIQGCISFLNDFHRGEATVKKGEKVAVIGDGNAAFDLARTLLRAGAEVTLVSWFEREKIPASQEEIDAAAEEGISIIDKSKTVAFAGNGGKLSHLVTKETKPGPPDINGIEWPVVIEESEPVYLYFDKAYVAIGQAGALQGCKGIDVNDFGYIDTDENSCTSLSNVYAGGDAVTGASTVVKAMAGGRAAAERALLEICGIDTKKNVPKRPVDKDFPEIPASVPTQKRAAMPELQTAGRKNGFAEVALGFSESETLFEARRCLQCGVCSECMQCAEACGAINAVRHSQEEVEEVEQAGVVIIADPDMAPTVRGEDVIRAYGPKNAAPDVYAMMMRGFSAAAQAMDLLGAASMAQKGHGVSFYQPDLQVAGEDRIGVFVCKCNGSLGWKDVMDSYVAGLVNSPDVLHSEVMQSACTPEGVESIIKTVRDKGLSKLVLASCVCCSLNFYCSACTDQRSRLKNGLFTATGITPSMVVTRNIRGEALTLLKKDPAEAMKKFQGLVDRSVKAARSMKTFPSPVRNYNFATAIVGTSEAARHSAEVLARSGVDVFLFANGDKPSEIAENYSNVHCFEHAAIEEIGGTLGDFRIEISDGEFSRSVHAGAIILEEKIAGKIGYLHQKGLEKTRIVGTMQEKGVTGIPYFYPGMTNIAGLFICDPPGVRISDRKKGEAAAVLAAAVMPRGPRKSKGYTVSIDKEICRNCGRCIAVCPYEAISLHQNEIGGWYAAVDVAFCKGCGNCISVCPSNAADSPYRSQRFFERTLEDILLEEKNA